jgi:hypothetical protein
VSPSIPVGGIPETRFHPLRRGYPTGPTFNPFLKELAAMWFSSGCGSPNDDHGDPSHIAQHKPQQAANTAGISTGVAVENIRSGVQES